MAKIPVDVDAFDTLSADKFLGAHHRALNRKRKLAQKLRSFLRNESIPWRHRYKEYINSDRWRGLRTQILNKRGRICERCGTVGNVDLHHLTYVRLGAELPSDLKVYCRDCHKLMHPGWR